MSIDLIISLVTFFLLVIFVLLHHGLSFQAVLLMHIIGFLCLGLLYELPEFGLDIFCLFRFRDIKMLGGSLDQLRKVVFVRYILTHILGPCFGVVTVFSGFCLIYVGHHSLKEAWLFWIVTLAAIFVTKGLFHHNPYLRKLYFDFLDKKNTQNVKSIYGLIYSPGDIFLNMLELPVYLFIFFTDFFKPQWGAPWEGIFQMFNQIPNGDLYGAAGYFLLICLGTVLIFCKNNPVNFGV